MCFVRPACKILWTTFWNSNALCISFVSLAILFFLWAYCFSYKQGQNIMLTLHIFYESWGDGCSNPTTVLWEILSSLSLTSITTVFETFCDQMVSMKSLSLWLKVSMWLLRVVYTINNPYYWYNDYPTRKSELHINIL